MIDPEILRSPDVDASHMPMLAVQPVGAYEQHGPRLPLATDATIATELARRAVGLLADPVWLLPTLPYGKSSEHMGRPGTVTLSTAAFTAICMDVAESLLVSGVSTLVFVNGHGGNPELLLAACRDIRARFGMRAYTVHAPSLPLPAPVPHPGPDFHAGFYETSVLLAISPEQVRPEAPGAPDPEPAAWPEARLVRDPWHIDDVSTDGVIGDPRGANAVWGEATLRAQAAALAALLREYSDDSEPVTA